MDLGTLGIVFGWLLHIDPGCVVCNWDPVSQSWVPAAATGAAAGGGLGLNDLFQTNPDGTVSETPSTGVGDTSNPQYSNPPADEAGDGLGLNDLFQTNPDGTVSETPSTGVGDTSDPQYSDTSAEDQVAADEAERQRASDNYRATHPGATTAGPPPPGDQTGAFFHRAVVDHIKNQ